MLTVNVNHMSAICWPYFELKTLIKTHKNHHKAMETQRFWPNSTQPTLSQWMRPGLGTWFVRTGSSMAWGSGFHNTATKSEKNAKNWPGKIGKNLETSGKMLGKKMPKSSWTWFEIMQVPPLLSFLLVCQFSQALCWFKDNPVITPPRSLFHPIINSGQQSWKK